MNNLEMHMHLKRDIVIHFKYIYGMLFKGVMFTCIYNKKKGNQKKCPTDSWLAF
jgi:hypothetical protein